jgi:hypothetical protein
MSYIAYINGQELEISDSKPIAQTKQVNDIASLESRQSNFTNTFTAPLTANNIKAMEFVYFVGNQSNIPYQKNEFDLIDADTGLHLIYKGWANVTKGSNKGYEIYVYDGNLDFYKAIENQTMGVLDLTALAHSKTLAEVVSTFDDSKPYKYILADYNGKALYDTNKINIDYLVPSVRASWLVSQIESYIGFTLNGSFKTNPDYLSLWMTYPKGTVSDLGTTDTFLTNDCTQEITSFQAISYSILDGFTLDVDQVNLISTKSQYVDITASHNAIAQGEDVYGEQYAVNLIVVTTINGVDYSGDKVSKQLEIGDVISFSLVPDGLAIGIVSWYLISGGFQEVLVKTYNSLNIDFLEELNGITIREFLDEIIWRFGLTLFKKKYENVFDFKTISEITNLENTIDWSPKVSSKEGEIYVSGSYAQQNYMRYKYNDDKSNYNDSYLLINNKNLDDFKTIIQSKIFSPELSSSNNLGFVSKVYKLWDKEPKDDGTVTYKPLQNRFYFTRSINKIFDTEISIGSESILTSLMITMAPVESFKGLSFLEIIGLYYPDIIKILNKSLKITCKMWLKNIDVSNIRFDVPYYIEQEAGYFMLNKINSFIPGKETLVELIRLNQPNEIQQIQLDYSFDYSNDYSH